MIMDSSGSAFDRSSEAAAGVGGASHVNLSGKRLRKIGLDFLWPNSFTCYPHEFPDDTEQAILFAGDESFFVLEPVRPLRGMPRFVVRQDLSCVRKDAGVI